MRTRIFAYGFWFVVALAIAYSYWVRNLELPAPATIDLTQLPENSLFLHGEAAYHESSVSMPLGMNVGAVVYYQIYGGSGVNTLILTVFRQDSGNPNILKRIRHDWLRPENVWSDTRFRHVSISDVTISGRIVTISPKKDFGTIFFAGVFIFMGLIGCAGFSGWFEPERTPHEKQLMPATC
jgi:hypothetical protein